MDNINITEGDMLASDGRFVLVASRFNSFIVEHLVSGALDVLRRHGVADERIELVRVPGAWELPLAARKVAESGKYDAVIALGAVIRGGTPHFEYVCSECVKGLGALALEKGLPVAMGVLTVDTVAQAIERAGTKAGNKGAEAAGSALEMVSLMRRLGE